MTWLIDQLIWQLTVISVIFHLFFPQIRSFEEGVASGLLKMDDFSAAEYMAVIDRTLGNLILWAQGHCYAQTVFTLLYLHRPQDVRDNFIRTHCWAIVALTENIRQAMLDGYVIEEEDFQVRLWIALVQLSIDCLNCLNLFRLIDWSIACLIDWLV